MLYLGILNLSLKLKCGKVQSINFLTISKNDLNEGKNNYQVSAVVDEAQCSRDGDWVVDVDGLRGDVSERDVGQDHLFAGSRKSVETRWTNKTQNLKPIEWSFTLEILFLTLTPRDFLTKHLYLVIIQFFHHHLNIFLVKKINWILFSYEISWMNDERVCLQTSFRQSTFELWKPK